MVKGLIYWGANNIFMVHPEGSKEGELQECRLKGKVLENVEDEHNPLAPGDWVLWEPNPNGIGGQILNRLERKNAYSRLNKKHGKPQTLAANIDLLVVVTSPISPPFRPRFLDRALIMGQLENLPTLILVNKIDQGMDELTEDRLATYQELGWDVILCSTLTNEGIIELKERLGSSICALVGQSGVGKSSLINLIHPDSRQRVGELSLKYNRGRHTTGLAVYYPWPGEEGGLIDTPGVRELEIHGIESASLAYYFPEMKEFLGHCSFTSCTHTHEPDCAVRRGVEEGKIHSDRWESYVKLFEELNNGENPWT